MKRRGPRHGLLAMLVTVSWGGCVVEPKLDVPLPTPTGLRDAQLIATAGGEHGLVDTRNLVARGRVLYVADAAGLFVFDTSDPQSPVLLAHVGGAPVDKLALAGTRLVTIDVNGTDRLRVFDVSTPARPVVVSDTRALTRTFGGIAVSADLVWHAVGSSPPSRLYPGAAVDPATSCAAPDRERGAMDVWLADDLAFVTLHFDDYAGDGLDGNGGFGLSVFRLTARAGRCPLVTPVDLVLAPSHSLNRSAHEKPSNSDLQVDFDPATRRLYLTGEQQLRVLQVDPSGLTRDLARLPLPEVLDVAATPTAVGAVNSDFLLLDPLDVGLTLSAVVPTPGVARAVAADPDLPDTFFVADGESGVAVIRHEAAAP